MSETTLLTLFFAIAAAAMIGAVNARGMLRGIISYALAAVCLGLALYHTYRYEARQNAAMDVLTTPMGNPDAAAPATDTDGSAEASAAHNLMSAQNQGQDADQNQGQDQSQGANTGTDPNSNQSQNQTQNPSPTQTSNLSDLRKITRDAQRLQSSLSGVNLAGVGQMSDAEYARLQSNARQYLTAAQNLQTRMATLGASPPMGQEESLQALTSAIGYQVSASHDLERFFSSENTADEKMHAAGFRNGVQAAGAALQKVESRMGGAENSAP
jgi:hypothetical protein